MSGHCAVGLWLRELGVGSVVDGAVCWLVRRSVTWLARLDVVVGDTASLGVLLCQLLVCRLGVDVDDIPGVDQTRKERETCEFIRYMVERISGVWNTAEEDVDQTVSRTYASLDPHGEWREEKGDERKEDVAAAHDG